MAYCHPLLSAIAPSDYDLSSVLHFRPLVTGAPRICHLCGNDNQLGYDNVCMGYKRLTIRRHDAIKNLLAKAMPVNVVTSSLAPWKANAVATSLSEAEVSAAVVRSTLT